MHAQTITLDQWANLNDRMSVTRRIVEGSTLVVVGTHPDLGACVIVQGADGVVLASDLPARVDDQ